MKFGNSEPIQLCIGYSGLRISGNCNLAGLHLLCRHPDTGNLQWVLSCTIHIHHHILSTLSFESGTALTDWELQAVVEESLLAEEVLVLSE